MKNRNILFIVDVGRDGALIHKINLEHGIYLMPKKIRDTTFHGQVEKVIQMIYQETPTQIVIDEIGMGRGFAEYLNFYMSQNKVFIKIHEDGKVEYL